MIKIFTKPEFKSYFSYFLIGLVTTGGVLIFWNLLIFLNNKWFNFEKDFWFSLSQYISSTVFIFPSFWLNRKFTFAGKKDRSTNFRQTTFKAYVVYLIAPLITSFVTYLIQQLIPNLSNLNLEFLTFLPAQIKVLPFGQLFLQIFGLALGMIINYSGQKYWIYEQN